MAAALSDVVGERSKVVVDASIQGVAGNLMWCMTTFTAHSKGHRQRKQLCKKSLVTEILFEAANIKKRLCWFATDQAKGAATSKSVFDF